MSAQNEKLSYADYAKRENTGDGKHEFYDGEMFAMSGGTREHGFMIERARDAIKQALFSNAKRACAMIGSEIRVRTPSGKGAYPDAYVVCGKIVWDSEDRDSVTNPTLVLEVLSEGTESYDREGKFKHYRSLPSLREYVLISYREPLMETRLRNADGTWSTTFAGPGEKLSLRSIDAAIDVDAVYTDMVSQGGRMVLVE
jgi:Uma2 family endonuclease